MTEKEPSLSLQDQLILLMIHSEKRGGEIARLCSLKNFSPDLRPIVKPLLKYWDSWGKPPGKAFKSLFISAFTEDDPKTEALEDTIDILVNSSNLFSEDDTATKIHLFLNHSEIKEKLYQAIDSIDIKEPDEEDIEKAKELCREAYRGESGRSEEAKVLTLKQWYAENREGLNKDTAQNDFILSGIRELDSENAIAVKKGLHLLMALPKRGKTWWLIHCGKIALAQGCRVLHVSLEMSAEQVLKRYAQSILRAATSNEVKITAIIKRDSGGFLKGVPEQIAQNPALIFGDKENLAEYDDRMRAWDSRIERLKVVAYPSGKLKINELEYLLDRLEHEEKWRPEVVLLDYVDIMHIPIKDYRLHLGSIFRDLRGLATERNLAMMTVSQGNREGARSTELGEEHVAEDFSKIATADCVLSFSQTKSEREKGLARILVVANRHGQSKSNILIAQDYNSGQFCTNSALVPRKYKPEEIEKV